MRSDAKYLKKKQGKAKRDGVINPQYYNFKKSYLFIFLFVIKVMVAFIVL